VRLGVSGSILREILAAKRRRVAAGEFTAESARAHLGSATASPGKAPDGARFATSLSSFFSKQILRSSLPRFLSEIKHRSPSGEVELPEGDESRGTLVWFGLVGLISETLREGSVLLADELEASLHPALVDVLVDLFQSPQSNPRRAQLIFNSHEARLMGDSSERRLGRDQIWFTEKDDEGATHLHPLADLAPRREEAIARRYLAGRYGGTPIFSSRRLKETAEPAGLGRGE